MLTGSGTSGAPTVSAKPLRTNAADDADGADGRIAAFSATAEDRSVVAPVVVIPDHAPGSVAEVDHDWG